MARSFFRCGFICAAAAAFVLLSDTAVAQEVGLVTLDVKDVAKGYRGEALRLKTVLNDKGESVGRIDDFIFARDDNQVFVVLSVGDFVGVGGSLVAVPFRSLKLDDPRGSIVLPGADRASLLKLPVFLYNR
jgi:sporulation protein YlmC with PRC-barrel domain